MEDGFRQSSAKRFRDQPFRKESLQGTTMGKTKIDQPSLQAKERKVKRERWLLTRKTWRYMADAGRRLIPEGAQNRQEDVPKIEAYFQEVCQREPKFLLWRKHSYPGALSGRTHGRRTRPRKKGGSCREKASSADEADELRNFGKNPAGSKMYMTPTTAGRFDLLKIPPRQKEPEDDLLNDLETFLRTKSSEGTKSFIHQELFDKLEKYLRDVRNMEKEMMQKVKCGQEVIPDPPQRELLDAIKRHYGKSTNREAVISNLLTDRKLLEKLYFDLRKARGFRSGTAYLPEFRAGLHSTRRDKGGHERTTTFRGGETSPNPEPNPSIEVQEVSRMTKVIQTARIHPDMVKAIEEKMRKDEEEPVRANVKELQRPIRRRSSLDHDDVSPSVGDTIKRYLKMARKKSIDTDKKDRFKTINYDETLRNIKPKGEYNAIGIDDGLNKGCQTAETWAKALKDFKMEEGWIVRDDEKEVISVGEEKSSKNSSDSLASSAGPHAKTGLLSSGQLFLSNLLHGLQHTDKNTVLPTAMQKSKSSTSVGRNLVSKKIWRGRSKSQSRLSTTQPCSWTPQGNCVWANLVGKQVTLMDTNVLNLCEIERRLLQKVALAKLQALNIGCQIQIPSEVAAPVETKAKRKPHLLKRKAITTSFFDTNRGKEKEIGAPASSGGMVFGVPIGQCIENERLSRNATFNLLKSKDSTTFPDDSNAELKRKSHHGSRTSFSSLVEPRPQDESAGSTESLGSSVPGLLDAISVGSTADITLNTAEYEHCIPNIVSSCLRHIENRGLHTLGIFRVSSSKKRVRQLRESFDSGKEICLDEYCPHDVATLLKEYFRDLPEPLLCKDLYQAFVHTQKLRNRKLQYEALQHLVQLLPVSNRDTLWSLLNFLSLIAANCDDHKNELGETVPGNKMDSNNLATLFAPNILHCCNSGTVTKESLSAQSCEERIDVINVIRSMIDHNRGLFQVSAELLDEVYLHMMDTHPEALDQLLRKRETVEEGFDDPDDSEVQEEIGTGSESSSLPQSPRNFAESEVAAADKEERKIYSRQQFLHDRSAYEIFESESRSRDKEKSKSNAARKGRRESSARLLTETFSQPSDIKYDNEENHSSAFTDTSGILKASLTIPTSSFTLNLDDSDIPYIEDSNNSNESAKQHPKASSTVRNRSSVSGSSGRYRSTNGSDSSQTLIPISVQAMTGSYSYNQGASVLGYDSAMGSSTAFSSPPRHYATSSICSGSDREYYSSPPSWSTTSPPMSPESQGSTLDDLSDEASASTIGKISIPTRTLTDTSNASSIDRDETEGEVVKFIVKTQKVPERAKPKEISRNSEMRKSQGENDRKQQQQQQQQQEATKSVANQKVHSSAGGTNSQSGTETFSKSAGQLPKRGENEMDSNEWSRKVTASISNIGGAVMRSKTADIERMLKIKPEARKSKGKTEIKLAKSEAEKKYSKRRYTDSRHPTKPIPDLSEKSPKSQSIWKRREIISSPPKNGEDS